MKISTKLIRIYTGALLTSLLIACGGGGGGGESSTAPAPVATASDTPANAGCPPNAKKITLTNSTIPGASVFISVGTGLRATYPNEPITVQACLVNNSQAGFPTLTAEISALRTNTSSIYTITALLAAGQFDKLLNKTIEIPAGYFGFTDEQLKAVKIIAYTKDASGVWGKQLLATTAVLSPVKDSFTPNVTYYAPITSPGYFELESPLSK
jgi:hypothetical protein